ncbi:hypothetical protein [Methanobrevibacter sp.]|uniref:hypothetical protein n=1 Tax=Methanobrevibacter sp. TaxID=66852 RepID=UPI00386D6260
MDKQQTIIAAVVLIVIIAIGAFIYVSSNTHNTKIEVLSNGTLKNGDYVTVMLTDEYRNPYPNETLYVKVLDDSGWPHKYEVKTDSEGQGSVQLMTLENGNYTIHCSYNGTLFNKASSCVKPLQINDGLN